MASPVTFSATMDVSAFMELCSAVLPKQTSDAIKTGTANAALRLQKMAREDLERMIYDTPESPSYKRTRTLFRATYAARPGANHSRDQDAAAAGEDLGLADLGGGKGGGFAVVKNYSARMEIGSWTDYAYLVHEGLGFNANVGPRPFMERVNKEGQNVLNEEIGQSIAEMLSSLVV